MIKPCFLTNFEIGYQNRKITKDNKKNLIVDFNLLLLPTKDIKRRCSNVFDFDFQYFRFLSLNW